MKQILLKLLFSARAEPENPTTNNSATYCNALLSKKIIKDIYLLYMQYRQSAGLQPNAWEVKKYLDIERTRGDDYFIIAHVSNMPVGFLHYTIERSTLRPAHRIRIKAVFVTEKYQGNGIAKQLLKELQKYAATTEIIVKARRNNKKSCNLYLGCEFTEDAEYMHMTYKEYSK